VLSRSSVAFSLLALVLAAGPDVLDAQPPRPLPPVRPAPGPPPPPANICTTQWGWCQLPTWTAPLGVGCACLTADDREVPGITRYFPYQGPASPYLQPHTSPPTTIP
jgi:hypothetical protein